MVSKCTYKNDEYIYIYTLIQAYSQVISINIGYVCLTCVHDLIEELSN